MNKKQVATWIVTGVLVAGVGAALAEEGAVGGDPTVTDTTVTTVDASTTTTVAGEDTTTTTEATDETTTTTEAVAEDTADVESEDAGAGNSAAAHNHDCDEAWGNHGAWVSANAHARRTGDEVSCDGPAAAATTDTTVAATADADTEDAADTADEADEADDVADMADTTDTTDTTVAASPAHGQGKGHGKGK